MSHTYINCLLHLVFSTRDRRPLIADSWRMRFHDLIGGIARHRGFHSLAVGGVADHVHALVSLPSGISIAEAMRLLKANSSKWANDTFFPGRDFAWQAGYGAFSIAQSQIAGTIAYIRDQDAHHRVRTFAEEYREFLLRQGIAWDGRRALG
jgi:REP element-mobilizing transposase RayT